MVINYMKCDLIAVSYHFDMHYLKDNLWDLRNLKLSALYPLNIGRLKWFICLLNLLSLHLFDKVRFHANLTKSSLPGLFTALLDEKLLNLQLFHLTREGLLM